MSSLQQYSFNFNKSLSYNFQGGNLSSDSGLLMIRSFVEKLEVKSLLEDIFKNNSYKKHSFASIAEQLIYTTIAGYRHDDDSDSLRSDPVFTNILGKKELASQPTISRFINSLDKKDIYRDLNVLWIFITLKTLTILRQLFGFTEEDLQVGTKKSQRHC